MASALDPVTGLPMLTVPDVVSQIPLGTQVVPWQDVHPSTLPPQGPAYPNDIINTFGWVTGEQVDNPGVVRAATMTPDRRLRVDAVLGSSGAAANAVEVDQIWEEFTTGASGNYTVIAKGSLPVIVAIFGFEFSFHSQSTLGIAATGDWRVFLDSFVPGFGSFQLGHGIISIDASGVQQDISICHVQKVWTNGIKVDTMLGGPSSQWALRVESGIDNLVSNLTLDYV